MTLGKVSTPTESRRRAVPVKARVNCRVVSRAVVIAVGVTATGDREVLGVEVGDSGNGAFWPPSLVRCLSARGLGGVQLVRDPASDRSTPLSRCQHLVRGNRG